MVDELDVVTGVDAGEEADDDVAPLLEFLRDRRGFDFTGYKRPSIIRRIRKRMRSVGATSFEDYLAVLESQPDEFTDLFDDILINVTGFLRDPDAWDRVRHEVLPAIVERSDATGKEIRLWSAGCATGQEAYTLAVLMVGLVGEERFRRGVKIYATDADETALRHARSARYPHAALVEAFGEEGASRYFEAAESSSVFRPDLRRSVIFGRHDLVQDPPISRIDMIVCRNTLMYFNADVQHRVLANFHFALVDGGFLFLGKAEAFATRTSLFSTLDLKRHIFVKLPQGAVVRPPLPSVKSGGRVDPAGVALMEATFEAGPSPMLAVDRRGILVAANRLARSLFGIGTNDVGRSLRDLEVSYRPVELRSVIEEVLESRAPATVAAIAFGPPHAAPRTFDVLVQSVEESGTVLGVTVTFVDVTRVNRLHEQLETSQHDVAIAREELQSAVEELETTNEELQSTNEELETTNEELHSTNEELETINEELQSTNEELETVNEQLRRRTEETNAANRFLNTVLSGLHAGVAVLDPDLTVRAWNAQAEELWGLRVDEVEGNQFFDLDIGLPVEQLRGRIRAVLAADGSAGRMELKAVNRRGRTIDIGVTASALGDDDHPDGVILLMEEVQDGDQRGR